MAAFEANPTAGVEVEPDPNEQLFTILVVLVSIAVWILLAVTIFGLIYVALFGVIFFIGHVLFISHIRGNGVRLGPDQLPDLYQAVERLAKRLGFEKVPEAYLLQAGGVLNALATKFFKSQMIVLYSDLIEACGDNTSARDMIIGHELAHLKRGHLKWHWFLLPGLMSPFLGQALSRSREYTCDRYGAALAADKKGATLGLAILAAGAEKGPKVNLGAMARQVHDLNTGWMTIGTWLSTHPPIAKRVIALEQGLRPADYVAHRGVGRALGILGALYVIPVVIGIVAAITVGVMSHAKKKAEGAAVEDLDRLEELFEEPAEENR